MACKIYLSTDDNAPVVAGNDRTCIINLLQKCLIDGYGSRQPAGGWTLPFRNAAGDIAVFRNSPDGTGHYLQINHSSAVSSSPHYYRQIGAEMASSETDLQNTFGSSNSLYASYSNDASARPWIVLANQYWVLLMVYVQKTGGIPTKSQLLSNGRTYGFWFGDFEKSFIDDAYNSMASLLYSSNHFGSSSSSSLSAAAAASYYYFSRNSSGVVGSVRGNAYLTHPCIAQPFGAGDSPAYSAQTGLYVTKISLNGGDNYTLRGWLPDALCPLHLRPFEQLEQVVINGTTYTAVCFGQGDSSSSPYQCQLLFEVET